MVPASEHQPFLPKDDMSTEPDHRCKHPLARKTVLSNLLVFVLTSLFWLAVISASDVSAKDPVSTQNHQSYRHNVTTHAKLLTCGSSSAEARAQDCKFDILLNNWVPQPCYDDEWIIEYQEDGSWGAYADENLTQRLTPEAMEDRDFYYTSLRDHINHCGMMWNKQFWALYEERTALDTMVVNPGHTEHCAQFLMDAREMDATQATKTHVGFAGCWIRAGTG